MSNSEINKVKELTEKIESNTASFTEYQEYQNILVQYGISQDMIDNELAEGNVKKITDLFLLRKTASDDRKKQINRFVVTGIVGLGLGLLLYWSSKRND